MQAGLDKGWSKFGGITTNEYRSAVCARLESLETDVHSPTRNKQKRQPGRTSPFAFPAFDDEPLVALVVQGVRPSKQVDGAIRGKSKTVSQTRGVSSRMLPSDATVVDGGQNPKNLY